MLPLWRLGDRLTSDGEGELLATAVFAELHLELLSPTVLYLPQYKDTMHTAI